MSHEPLMTALERILNELTLDARLRARSTITSVQALVREADRLVDNLVSTAQATSAIPHDLPMNQGFVHDDQLFDRERLMAMRPESEPLDLSGYHIKNEVLNLLPHGVARDRQIVPLVLFEKILVCAMSADKVNTRQYLFAIDDARFMTGYEVHAIPATPQSLAKVMEHYDRLAADDEAKARTSDELGPRGENDKDRTVPARYSLVYEGAMHTSRGVPPGEVSGVKGRKLEGQLLAALEVPDNVLNYLQTYFRVPAVDISALEIGIDFPTFPLAIAQGYEMIAIGRDEDGHTRVVMAEPHREEAARILNRVFGEGNWKKLVALQRDIKEAIKNNYADRLRASASPFNG